MFPNVPKITDFQIIRSNLRVGKTDPRDIEDGVILYGGKNYYFKFSHEFDVGNTYIVYNDKQNPFAYFSIMFTED